MDVGGGAPASVGALREIYDELLMRLTGRTKGLLDEIEMRLLDQIVVSPTQTRMVRCRPTPNRMK